MKIFQKDVLLPQTAEALEKFIDTVTREFDLTPGDETAYSITSMISRLPAEQAFVSKKYLADAVRRGVAQVHAYKKHEEVRRRLVEATEKEKSEKEAAEKAEKEKAGLTLVQNEVSPVVSEPLQNA